MLEDSMVKGVIFRGILRDIKEVFPGGIPKFLESMPPSIRERDFSYNIVHGVWYPYETFIAMLDTYLHVIGNGRQASLEELGERAAVRDLGTILKIYAKFSSPQRIGEQSSTIWPQRFKNSGYMTITEKQDRSFRLSVKDFKEIHPLNCFFLTGFGRGVVRTWRKKAIVLHDHCVHHGDEDCSWLSSW